VKCWSPPICEAGVKRNLPRSLFSHAGPFTEKGIQQMWSSTQEGLPDDERDGAGAAEGLSPRGRLKPPSTVALAKHYCLFRENAAVAAPIVRSSRLEPPSGV
jgi:hypothetical protein